MRDPFATRVLLVDSYRDAAESTAMLLQLWGYDVQVASTGRAALSVARTFLPDVVLTELTLQGTLLACDLPVQAVLIALTRYDAAVHRRRAGEAGCSHFLVKPADPEELYEVLRASEPCLPTCVVNFRRSYGRPPAHHRG